MAKPMGNEIRRAFLAILLSLPAVASCGGDTGGKRFLFEAKVGGARRSETGPWVFTNERGWAISLQEARLTLGPIYLSTTAPVADARPRWQRSLLKTAFAGPGDGGGRGRILGEVLSQVQVDLLSPELVLFPTQGVLSEEPVRTADVWFYPEPGVSPDMNRISTVALQVRGEATRDGKSERFRGSLVLNDDWLPNATEGRRGSMTVADVRKVRGVPANLTPQEGGFLQIRIDPRFLFRGADFSALEQNPKDADGTRVLLQGKTASSTTDQVMANLYQGLRSLGGTYEFRWVAPEMSETNP